MIKCKETNEFYIGSTNNLRTRMSGHIIDSKDSKRKNCSSK